MSSQELTSSALNTNFDEVRISPFKPSGLIRSQDAAGAHAGPHRSTANRLFAAILLIAVNCAVASDSVNRPERIASTHLCTDQLLSLIAEPERIVSLSYFAGDSGISMIADFAQSFPANHGLAEEMIVLKPDLIFTSQFGSPNVLLLRRLGYRIVNVPVALSFEDVRTNIRTVANAVGNPMRGEELIREFDRRINSVELPDYDSRPRIAVYDPRGFTVGSNTLKSDIVEQAGFRNLAVEIGISDTRHLPLELLVAHDLDALLIKSEFEHTALANELPRHPAIRARFQNIPRIHVQGKYWICGTPFMADALDQLVEFRKQVASRRE